MEVTGIPRRGFSREREVRLRLSPARFGAAPRSAKPVSGLNVINLINLIENRDGGKGSTVGCGHLLVACRFQHNAIPHCDREQNSNFVPSRAMQMSADPAASKSLVHALKRSFPGEVSCVALARAFRVAEEVSDGSAPTSEKSVSFAFFRRVLRLCGVASVATTKKLFLGARPCNGVIDFVAFLDDVFTGPHIGPGISGSPTERRLACDLVLGRVPDDATSPAPRPPAPKKPGSAGSSKQSYRVLPMDGMSTKSLLDVLRSKLAKEATGGVAGMLRSFRKFQAQGREVGAPTPRDSATVNYRQFRKSLWNVGIILSKPVMKQLFHQLDLNGDGVISASEFATGVFGAAAVRDAASVTSRRPNTAFTVASRASRATAISRYRAAAASLTAQQQQRGEEEVCVSIEGLRRCQEDYAGRLKREERAAWLRQRRIQAQAKAALAAASDNPNGSISNDRFGEDEHTIREKEAAAALREAEMASLKKRIAARALKLTEGRGGDHAIQEYLKKVARDALAEAEGNSDDVNKAVNTKDLARGVLQLGQLKNAMRHLGFYDDLSAESLFRDLQRPGVAPGGKPGIVFHDFASLVLGARGCSALLMQAKKDEEAQRIRKANCSAPDSGADGGAAAAIFQPWGGARDESAVEKINNGAAVLEEEEEEEGRFEAAPASVSIDSVALQHRPHLASTTTQIAKAVEAHEKARRRLLQLEPAERGGGMGYEKAKSLQDILSGGHSERDLQFHSLLKDAEKMEHWWNWMDMNGNGICSLAEIDKFITHVPGFEKFNNKPALMRAYKRTISREGGGDGDDWVQRYEFPALLRNVYYFNKLWKVFEDIDASGDRRLDASEFASGLRKLGCRLSEKESLREFHKMDDNGGGFVLFEEFCVRIAEMATPLHTLASMPKKKKKNSGMGCNGNINVDADAVHATNDDYDGAVAVAAEDDYSGDTNMYDWEREHGIDIESLLAASGGDDDSDDGRLNLPPLSSGRSRRSGWSTRRPRTAKYTPRYQPRPTTSASSRAFDRRNNIFHRDNII